VEIVQRNIGQILPIFGLFYFVWEFGFKKANLASLLWGVRRASVVELRTISVHFRRAFAVLSEIGHGEQSERKLLEIN